MKPDNSYPFINKQKPNNYFDPAHWFDITIDGRKNKTINREIKENFQNVVELVFKYLNITLAWLVFAAEPQIIARGEMPNP